MPSSLENDRVSATGVSVLGVLEDNRLSLADKASVFEGRFGVPITKKRDYLHRWSQFLSQEAGGTLITEQVDKIVEKFRGFHNINDSDLGEKAGHNTLTNFLYSDLFLPTLVSIYNHATENQDVAALKKSSLAILILNDALDILQTEDPQKLRESDEQNLLLIEQTGSTGTLLEPFDKPSAVNLGEVLPQLHVASMFGSNTDLQNLYSLLAMARLAAFQCIHENKEKDIKLDSKIKLPKARKPSSFTDLAERAEQHFLELHSGVMFPPDLFTKIGQSKALVLSIDWNSVWNMSESYANSHIIALTTETIKKLTNDFYNRFPDKEIFFVMNTGRPAHYAWGVIEALSVIKELRIIGLAESGGVILKTGMAKGETEVAVENPRQWEIQLQALKTHLLGMIKNPLSIHIEPKQSMLSIKLAEKDVTSGPWLHQTKDGQAVNPQWIADQTRSYLLQRQREMTSEANMLTKAISSDDQLGGKVLEALTQLGSADADGQINTADDLTQKDLLNIATIFNEARESRGLRLLEVHDTLKVVNLMCRKIKSVYNSRAGFIDIGNWELNKYSTLIDQLEKQFGFNDKEVVIISIGDSETDIVPVDHAVDGDINHGADEVLSIAVGNASPALRVAVEKRRQKNNRGIQTVTPSILGLISIIKGLENLISR
ncbi:MAG: hypothetical protein U1C50_00075 [Patescibacteria group bacterium]|nr:hypothetical protein [Patescibacteria group bacterium]